MGATKYNKAMADAICDLVGQGVPYKYAAMAVGICEKTFYNWRDKHLQFDTALKKAEGEFIKAHLNSISAHRYKDWKASAWLLERRHPEEFALNRLAVEGDVQVKIVFEDTVKKPAKKVPAKKAKGRGSGT